MSGNHKNQNGFSLIEAMLATVILGIAATTIILPFTTGAAVQNEGVHRTLAAKLATDLMEQIISTPFYDIEGDYDGYDEKEGEIEDFQGQLFTGPDYANFSRKAECDYVYVGQQTGLQAPTFILATVKVYYWGREIANISMLIGEYDDESTIDFL